MACGCVTELNAALATIEARLTTIDTAFAANLTAINAVSGEVGQTEQVEDERPDIEDMDI